MTNKKTILFMGVQGSGKGTQVKLLKEALEKESDRDVFAYVSGDRLREFAKGDSYTAKKVKETLRGGGLLPPNIPTWLWSDAFATEIPAEDHLIIDGSPRTLFEARLLEAALSFYGRDECDVVRLMLHEDKVVERLLERGRQDDTPESIKERLGWHYAQVSPLIDWFRQRGDYHIHEIEADQAIEDVHRDVVQALRVNE